MKNSRKGSMSDTLHISGYVMISGSIVTMIKKLARVKVI